MSIFTARYIKYSIMTMNLLYYVIPNIRSCLRAEGWLKADLEYVARPPHQGNIYKTELFKVITVTYHFELSKVPESF